MTTVSVPQNWRSLVNQVVLGYKTEPAKGLVHGIQKDLVQNSWGQRVDINNGLNWKMNFQLISNDKGNFLIIEDIGTHGMTGENLSMNEIDNLTTDLPPEFRLARFSAMNYSGGNEGAGLFGRGKLIFTAASANGYYIFESLSCDGYRVNYKKLDGNALKIEPLAYEDEVAKTFIEQETNLTPIENNGTRIIIVNPIDELVASIKNGEFLTHINETWWPIFKKYNASISVINARGEESFGSVPAEYREENTEHLKHYEDLSLRGFTKITNLTFGISHEPISEDLTGIYLYRKNMKMGEIALDIPEELQKKLFGFIEVDTEFENVIAQIENLEHYGFTSRRHNSYQSLKHVISDTLNTFLIETGYRTDNTTTNNELQNELFDIADELDNFLSDFNNIQDLNDNNTRSKFDLKWNGINFPEDKGNYLTLNDSVTDIGFSITNNYTVQKKFNVSLNIICEKRVVMSLYEEEIRIRNGETYNSDNFYFIIDDQFIPNKRYSVVLSVSPVNTLKEEKITSTFYYDVEQREPIQKEFAVTLESIQFPTPNSKRVNTNEELKDISYKIKNNSPYEATLGFRVSLYGPGKVLLENIYLEQFTIPSYSENIVNCSDVIFSQELYEDVIVKGPIEIHAVLSALTDFGPYAMADIIFDKTPLIIYFNESEHLVAQTFNEMSMIEDDELRSKVSENPENRIFYLCINHPHYLKFAENEEFRKEYIAEEMLKKTIYVKIANREFSILNMFSEERIPFEDLSEAELLKHVNSVVDKIQSQRHTV